MTLKRLKKARKHPVSATVWVFATVVAAVILRTVPL